MVARSSGYYGDHFHRSQGVTQGDPLSSLIFNVAVDTIILNWVGIVADNESGPGGIDRN